MENGGGWGGAEQATGLTSNFFDPIFHKEVLYALGFISLVIGLAGFTGK